MPVRNDRSRYTHFNAASRWRIWVVDEPDDVVLGVDYLDAPQPHGKWHNVARLDESGHDSFHAHLPSHEGISVPIGVGLTREDKIKLGFQELTRFAKEGRIFQGDDICSPEEIWQALQPQVFGQMAAKGSTHHNVSITGTARIVSNLDANQGL